MIADVRAQVPRLRALTPADYPQAIAAQVDGFMADPLFTWLVPDASKRVRWIAALMRANIRMFRHNGLLLAAESPSNGALVAVKPGGYPAPMLTQTWAIGAILLQSLTAGFWRERRWQVGLQALNLVTKLHVRERHWYLATFSLATKAQSKGYGRALMENLLAAADRDRLPVYLETANPKNLSYYGRFGFAVTQQLDLPFGSPPLWLMLRPARNS